MSAGVALVTTDTPFGRQMAARLDRALSDGPDPLRAVLVNRKPANGNGRRRLPGLNRLQRAVLPDKRVAHAAWLLQQQADAAFEIETGPLPDWPETCVVREACPSRINDADTVGWLAGVAPRLLISAGAPILRAPILAVPPLGVLNLHSSLLPRYRGTRAEFWQVHNDDLSHAGLTVHFVDAGVDSGDIVLQVPLQTSPSEGPWMMRARNQIAALEALPEAALQVLAGTAVRRPQERSDERPYRFADITPAAIRRVLMRMKRASVSR
ncbi:hypothetical protein MWU52_13125 [Jannaschia sp. S6380]|uniref:formyltransferase family protein n=1 Tax=Jannaschia sp. S6380 TaxID=2926408 RepID=UPI001FF67625|nr:formyltransferase family protein [Jannaschia sp. S6380]MCK0168501.1 hypothetical protein [Jannaschia sp. S6380]